MIPLSSSALPAPSTLDRVQCMGKVLPSVLATLVTAVVSVALGRLAFSMEQPFLTKSRNLKNATFYMLSSITFSQVMKYTLSKVVKTYQLFRLYYWASQAPSKKQLEERVELAKWASQAPSIAQLEQRVELAKWVSQGPANLFEIRVQYAEHLDQWITQVSADQEQAHLIIENALDVVDQISQCKPETENSLQIQKDLLNWVIQEASLSTDAMELLHKVVLPRSLFDQRNSSCLDLAGLNLSSLPPLTWLYPYTFSSINLRGNQLKEIPDELYFLPRLTELYLGWNCIETLNPQIFGVSSLKVLDLSYNCIASLPEDLPAGATLEELDLSNNPLHTVPLSIVSRVSNVLALQNKLNSIPSDIKSIENLLSSCSSELLVCKSIFQINVERMLGYLSSTTTTMEMFENANSNEEVQVFFKSLVQDLKKAIEINNMAEILNVESRPKKVLFYLPQVLDSQQTAISLLHTSSPSNVLMSNVLAEDNNQTTWLEGFEYNIDMVTEIPSLSTVEYTDTFQESLNAWLSAYLELYSSTMRVQLSGPIGFIDESGEMLIQLSDSLDFIDENKQDLLHRFLTQDLPKIPYYQTGWAINKVLRLLQNLFFKEGWAQKAAFDFLESEETTCGDRALIKLGFLEALEKVSKQSALNDLESLAPALLKFELIQCVMKFIVQKRPNDKENAETVLGLFKALEKRKWDLFLSLPYMEYEHLSLHMNYIDEIDNNLKSFAQSIESQSIALVQNNIWQERFPPYTPSSVHTLEQLLSDLENRDNETGQLISLSENNQWIAKDSENLKEIDALFKEMSQTDDDLLNTLNTLSDYSAQTNQIKDIFSYIGQKETEKFLRFLDAKETTKAEIFSSNPNIDQRSEKWQNLLGLSVLNEYQSISFETFQEKLNKSKEECLRSS